MMRTEDDVRAVLREVAGSAESMEDVLHRLQVTQLAPTGPRRRGFLIVAAACAAVAVVAASAVLLGRHVHPATRPAVRSPMTSPITSTVTSPITMPLGPTFAFKFRLGALPPGYVVIDQQITPTMQLARIGRKQPDGCEGPTIPAGLDCGLGQRVSTALDGYAVMAGVALLGKGQFDPSAMKDATTVDVNGKPGLLSDVARPSTAMEWLVAGYTGEGNAPPLTTLAWQYAPYSWALVVWRNNSEPNARAMVQALARAASVGNPRGALVPFSIRYLPAVLDRRDSLVVDELRHIVTVSFGSATPGPRESLLSVSVIPKDMSDATVQYDMSRRAGSILGQPEHTAPGFSGRTFGCGAGCTVGVGTTARLTSAEEAKIAQSVTPAHTLTDTSTWFDATIALPH